MSGKGLDKASAEAAQLLFHRGNVEDGDSGLDDFVMDDLGRFIVGLGGLIGVLFNVGGKGHLGLTAVAGDIKHALVINDVGNLNVLWQNSRLTLNAIKRLGNLGVYLVNVMVIQIFHFVFF